MSPMTIVFVVSAVRLLNRPQSFTRFAACQHIRQLMLNQPGAWHNPDCFSIVADQLRSVAYRICFVHHPSVAEPSPELPDFSADVAEIRSHIQRAADVGEEVMVFMHSYGGVVGTEAVKGFDKSSREKNGQPGGVTQLFYCCAFILSEGESLSSAFGGADRPWYDISEDRLELRPATPADTFCNDMPAEMVELAVAQLKPMSYRVLSTETTYAAWKHVPSTYLYCLQDAAIPLEVQEMMVKDWAKDGEVRRETVDAGHSPFYSQPDAVVSAVRRAAGEEVQLRLSC